MNYGDLIKAETALKTIWRDFNTMDAGPIDYVFKELGLEEVQAEMMNKGILCYRRKYNDYFIPWHNNKFGPNTVDSVKSELLKDAFLECDPECAKLNQEKKSLEERLAEVNKALEEKQRVIPRLKILEIGGVNTSQIDDETCMEFSKDNLIICNIESETIALLDKYFGRDKDCLDAVKASDELNLDFSKFKSIKEQIDSIKVADDETPCETFSVPDTPGEWCQDCTKSSCRFNRLNPANVKPKSFTDLSAEEPGKLALSK